MHHQKNSHQCFLISVLGVSHQDCAISNTCEFKQKTLNSDSIRTDVARVIGCEMKKAPRVSAEIASHGRRAKGLVCACAATTAPRCSRSSRSLVTQPPPGENVHQSKSKVRLKYKNAHPKYKLKYEVELKYKDAYPQYQVKHKARLKYKNAHSRNKVKYKDDGDA